jgi:hypothetical protein
MSNYQSWAIAPTKARPHPNFLGEGDWADYIDWTKIADASLKVLPSIISSITAQATSEAQASGATPAQLVALQNQIAAITSNRSKIKKEAKKQTERENSTKTRNILILSGIGVVGILGAILILK